MASSFTRFLDHTQRRTTVGRTPLNEWSARRRGLYLTSHNIHRQTSVPPVGFEPTVSAGERPQTYALGRAATGIGSNFCCTTQIMTLRASLYSSNLQLGPLSDVLFSAPSPQTIPISPVYEHSSSCMHTKTRHTVTFNGTCNYTDVYPALTLSWNTLHSTQSDHWV